MPQDAHPEALVADPCNTGADLPETDDTQGSPPQLTGKILVTDVKLIPANMSVHGGKIFDQGQDHREGVLDDRDRIRPRHTGDQYPQFSGRPDIHIVHACSCSRDDPEVFTVMKQLPGNPDPRS